MFADRREVPCRVELLDADRLTLIAPHQGPAGSRVIAYLDGLGRVEGQILRKSGCGLEVAIVATSGKRARLSRRLEWRAARARGEASERRLFERDERRGGQRVTISIDGAICHGAIVDESASGMALSLDGDPAVGSYLFVDGALAQIVRKLPNGVAVKFVARRSSERHEGGEAPRFPA